ncbi:MAG: hypothetical protein AB7F28_07075 [Candidatus Margulisiibacteriota bacterium]
MSHASVITHDQSEPRGKAIAVAILLTVLFLVGVIVFSIYLFKATLSTEMNGKENEGMSADLQRVRLYEQEQLSKTAWVDQKQGIVHIPIDDAKQLVVRHYSQHN